MTQSRSTGGKVKERTGPWWDANPQVLTPMSPKSNTLPLTLPRLPEQGNDEFCDEMINFINDTEVPDNDQRARKLALMAEYFGVEQGILVRYPPVSRKSKKELIKVRRCMVIPSSLVGDLLYCLHDVKRSGHIGRDALMTRVMEKYWWPSMMADIYQYVKTCEVCQRRKSDTHRSKPELQPYGVPRGFLEVVTTDIAGPLPPSGPSGHRFLVIFGCAYSGMVFAFPTPRHTAEVIANLFVNEICLKFGITPKRLHSDRGTDYTSRLVKAVCNLLQVEKTESVAYLPRSNGMAENNVAKVKQKLSVILRGGPRS